MLLQMNHLLQCFSIDYLSTAADATDGDDDGITPFSGSSLSSCFVCKLQKLMDRHVELIKRIDALTNVIKKLATKRGVIPSKKIREPCIHVVKRKIKTIEQHSQEVY